MTRLSDEGLDAVEALMLRLAGEDALGKMAAEHLSTGGKRLRARLALGAAGALGVSRADAVAWAAACELLHNATLVHDDLQDGDTLRRGHPTVWVRHGAASAINTGDLMFGLPTVALAQVPARDAVRWGLALALGTALVDVSRGQAAELGLLGRGAVAWADYEQAVVGKTSALFDLPVRGAALLAGRADAAALAAPFRGLGVLFQLQDDVLDVYGDKGRAAPAQDLYEGKVSGLVVEHLARVPADGDALLSFLRRPRADKATDEAARWIQAFRASGALGGALQRIDELRRSLNDLPEAPELRVILDELVDLALAPIAHVRA